MKLTLVMFRCEKSKYIDLIAVLVLRIMITRFKEGIAIEAKEYHLERFLSAQNSSGTGWVLPS